MTVPYTFATASGFLPLSQLDANFAAVGQSANIAYTYPATNAVARTSSSKMSDVVSVKDFGAVGNGTTDDTTAIQNAINSLGSKGGMVYLPLGNSYYIGSNLTINKSVTLVGPYDFAGTNGSAASEPYGDLSAVILNSSATITLKAGAGITGCFIYRYGMTFPTVNASAFAGTAITGGGDDYFVTNCFIIGFNQAIYSTGYGRPRIYNNLLDCQNGVWIDNCTDVSRIRDCHAWPFATIQAVTAGTAGASLNRSGYGFNFTTADDAGQVSGCLALGYSVGFRVNSCNGLTFLNCDAEGFNVASSGVVGFRIDGGSTANVLLACQTYGCDIQVYSNSNTIPNIPTQIIGCTLGGGGNGSIGIEVDSAGDVIVIGGIISGVTNGVFVNNSNSDVNLTSVLFKDITGHPLFANAVNGNIIINNCVWGDAGAGAEFSAGANAGIPSISSAAILSPTPNRNFFNVTGSTTVTGGVYGGYADRTVTFKFADGLTFNNGGSLPNSVRLQNNSNYTFGAGATLTLTHDGYQWYETSRAT